jgi:hypothetical protein
MNGYGKLRRCTDKRKIILQFYLCIAATPTVIRRSIHRAAPTIAGPAAPPPVDSP